MRLSSLSDEELLRCSTPETDLERLLVERLGAAVDEIARCDSPTAYGCGDCCDKDAQNDELNQEIDRLEALLDKHDIKHET